MINELINYSTALLALLLFYANIKIVNYILRLKGRTKNDKREYFGLYSNDAIQESKGLFDIRSLRE